jgi:hypothetical protein
MLTLVAATMLSLAAMKGDPLDDARKAFNNCMIETHNTAVGEKVSPSAFVKTTETACTAQRTAYHAILVKSERSYGSNAKDAEQYANEEVQGLVDSVVSAFNENVDNGAKLSPEK